MRFSPLRHSARNCCPSFRLQHRLNRLQDPRSRCLPRVPRELPRTWPKSFHRTTLRRKRLRPFPFPESRNLQDAAPLQLPGVPPLPHPKPAANAACHKKSSHPQETAESSHRSVRTRAVSQRPTPRQNEIPANRAVGGIAQSLPDSVCPFRRSVHSPVPPRLFPAAAVASAPALPHRGRAPPSTLLPQPTFFSCSQFPSPPHPRFRVNSYLRALV